MVHSIPIYSTFHKAVKPDYYYIVMIDNYLTINAHVIILMFLEFLQVMSGLLLFPYIEARAARIGIAIILGKLMAHDVLQVFQMTTMLCRN